MPVALEELVEQLKRDPRRLVRTHVGGLTIEVRAVAEPPAGKSAADFDLIIACTALDLGAALVTNDQALLDGSICGLGSETWLS